MNRCVLVVFLSLLGAATSVAGGERPIVAVFDMEDRTSTFDKQVRDNLTEYLAVKLAEGGFQVIPREQVRQRLLDEKRKTYKECYDSSCQVEMGRELAAQKMISTRIIKVAGKCQLVVTLYDLKKAVTEKAASAEGSCDEKSMGQAILKVSAELSGKAVSEFDDYLTAARKKVADRQRVGEAWKIIRALADDPDEPLESRMAALRKFLEEFGERNPHRAEARALLEKLSVGTLAVSTVPAGARVTIDGSDLGSAPLAKKVRAGRHQVSVAYRGYHEKQSAVEVKPGKRVQLKIELVKLKPARLKVVTDPPGAKVLLGGENMGAAPVDREIAPGKYALSVVADDYLPQSRRVELTSGKATEVRLVLESAPPYRSWGHITFWSGLGAAAFGAVSGFLAKSAGDDYKAGDRSAYDSSVAWTGCMYAGLAAGGALMVSGIVLWAVSPSENIPQDSPWLGAIPTSGGGMVFSLGGRF